MEADHYKTQIYYVQTHDIFHIVDYNAKPSSSSFVVVERRSDGRLVIERFNGQKNYIGVANFLNFYQLKNSCQQNHELQRPKGEKVPKPKVHRPRNRRVYWPRQIAS